jgi:hypothetical protein
MTFEIVLRIVKDLSFNTLSYFPPRFCPKRDGPELLAAYPVTVVVFIN